MEVLNGKAVKLNTRLTDTILKQIPKSKNLGRIPDTDIDEVLIYWGRDEVRALHSLGFKNVPPAPLNGTPKGYRGIPYHP